MSSTVEERIVKITFDNKQFEEGITRSRNSLGQFTKTLQLDGAAKGLTDVGTAGTSLSSKLEGVFTKIKTSLSGTTKGLEEVDATEKKISFQGLADGVDAIAQKFTTMSAVGVAALSHIVNKAVDAGISLVKSLTIDPIKDGFTNYETQINATQTILANTAAAGTTLKQVTTALAELNTYANQTVYNFSDMTKNIGTFTAAGVKLKPAVEAIKGIANLAAMSGSTSEQASTAMYQLSQAMAAGVVHLQDWNSVVNAGLGGKTFQTALENTARASGVSIDKIIAKQGGFRNSLQKGWLTSDILSKTLSQFTGDLTLKQIEAMGYTAKQAQGILALGKVAVDSATKIKTMTQLSQALKEEVATAYATIFKTIFGGIGQATDLFSKVHTVLENAITGPIYAINTLLQGWDKLGGRTVIIKAIGNAFNAVVAVIHAVTSAFREVFPPTTAKQLYDFSVSLEQFTEKLKMGGKTADELKRTFAGVFAVLDIGWQIIKKVAETIGGLFSTATAGSGGILTFTARIGDWLVNLDKAIKKGEDLNRFFSGLQKYLTIPIQLIRELGTYLGSIFNKFDAAKTQNDIAGITGKLAPLAALGKVVTNAWDRFVALLPGVWKAFEPVAKKIGDFFKQLGNNIITSLSGLSWSDVLNTINTLLLGGIVLLFKNFIGKLRGTVGGGGGMFHAITESFDELTKTLHTMQGTLKAATLLEIAIAIGILTISVSVLSKIDSAGLTRAVTAMGLMFSELLGSMAILQKVLGTTGFLKIPIIAAGFILLAIAIDLLTMSIVQLSKLSWPDLEKGLKGLGIILLELVGTLKLMPPAPGLIATSIALVILAGGIKILVGAVTQLGGLSWTELQKGLIGVGGLLASLALFTKFSEADKGGVLQGAGIILLAVGIKILASAMKDFGSFSWTEIGKGLTVLAGALGLMGAALILIPPTAPLSAVGVLILATSLSIIGKAMEAMGKQSWTSIGKSMAVMAGALTLITAALILIPPTALLSAAGVYVVAMALTTIADVMAKMGGMSWTEIGKSLVVLAGSLTIITAAMILMTEALPGAAALLVVAASLMILVPVLQAFGQMSWSEIGKSMLMLAGVFAIIGLAGLLLTPVIPTLIGLGIAITLLGVGMLAAGGGLLLFSTALTALSISGAAGGLAIIGIVAGLAGLIPYVMKEIGLGLELFAKTIATAGPSILAAITTVLEALLGAIVKVIPDVVTAIFKLLTALIDTMNKYVPHLIDAGSRLIVSILHGISLHIGGIVTAAANAVVSFLNGVSMNLPKIIQAGVNLIIAFINGIANAIRNNSKAMGEAGGNLASALVQGMVSGIRGAAGTIISAAKDMAMSAYHSAMNAIEAKSPSRLFMRVGNYVGQGFAVGIRGSQPQIDAAFQNMYNQLVSAIDQSKNSIATLTAHLSKLTHARHQDRAAIALTRAEIAQANKEHRAELAAYTELTQGLTKMHAAQDKLAARYSVLTTKIKDANTELANAIKTRDDYNKQISQQYDTAPAVTGTTKVVDYVSDIKTQIEKTKEFANALQRLRKLGINDNMYKQLLAGGVDELPFVQQLLDSGKTGVNQVNDLGKQLDTASASLGKTASSDLYQAAVDSAAGLVKGLENQQSAIAKQMEKIAEAMVAALRKKLGIKSPSTVLAEVGEFAGQGFSNGFENMSATVEKSAALVGQKAIDSLSKSLSGIPSLVSGNMDIRPTITPVLDLSSVKKDAATIGGMLTSQPLSVDAAYNKALLVASGTMTDGSAAAKASDAKAYPAAPPIVYNQYNNSPEALSPADIYRQTKNQLSTVKGVLSFNAVQGGSPNQSG